MMIIVANFKLCNKYFKYKKTPKEKKELNEIGESLLEVRLGLSLKNSLFLTIITLLSSYILMFLKLMLK